MDEYISREKLRKHLKECYDNELFDADMKKAVFGIDIYVENMPSADVQPVNQWIAVKNKLPEDSGEYMVYIVANNCPKNKSIITLYYTNLSKRFVYYDDDNIFTVTHWCYLPEPPESE